MVQAPVWLAYARHLLGALTSLFRLNICIWMRDFFCR